MNRPRVVCRCGFTLAALLLVSLCSGSARADRRFFTYTYSPFLESPGELEVESWLTARTGKQDPAIETQWEPRLEIEYAFHGRLGTAAYLNFRKEPGSDLEFHSPSIELIYALAEPGKLPGDPAVYLETSESGDELELESKLLLAHRRNRWVSGANLIGEFEFRHDDDERLPSGKVLENQFAGEVTAGLAYELNGHVSLGIESRYRSEHPNFGGQSGAFLAVGPCFNLKFGEMQLATGVLPQVWGTPGNADHLNLDDFEKVQTRVILGFEL